MKKLNYFTKLDIIGAVVWDIILGIAIACVWTVIKDETVATYVFKGILTAVLGLVIILMNFYVGEEIYKDLKGVQKRGE